MALNTKNPAKLNQVNRFFREKGLRGVRWVNCFSSQPIPQSAVRAIKAEGMAPAKMS